MALTLTVLVACMGDVAYIYEPPGIEKTLDSTPEPSTAPTTETAAGAPDESTTSTETIQAVTAYENPLDYYTEFLSDRINNRFIRFEFGTKDELNLALVFYEDFMLRAPWGEHYYAGRISDNEKAALLELLDIDPENNHMGDITRCFVPEAVDFLYYMTGYEFTREELGAALNAYGYVWTYMENWDAYYFMHGDTEYMAVTCVRVIELDQGQTEIYYTDGANLCAVLTIEEIEGRIVFCSNRYL